MSRRLLVFSLVVVSAVGSTGVAVPGTTSDRLDRFRTLAATRLSIAQVVDPERAEAAYREVLALLDEEIVESLGSGSVFASLEFLQDRLDGFAEAWGGASLRLTRVGPFTVGAFHLSDGATESWVRVYGTSRGEAQLLAVLQREGRAAVHPIPAAPGGAAQFLVAWEGAPSGRGTRALRLDLARQLGDDVAVVWSTASLYPDGLVAHDWRVRAGEIRIRYELRYPGWIPGCELQTEQEDVYRLAQETAMFFRATRRQFNAWHATLHRTVAGLFAAIAAGDRAGLAALVPDARVRQQLPPNLQPEPACDAPDAPNPAVVSVAASTTGLAPWALTFSRSGGQWRLTAAAPVLQ